jgi:hypothetical protein
MLQVTRKRLIVPESEQVVEMNREFGERDCIVLPQLIERGLISCYALVRHCGAYHRGLIYFRARLSHDDQGSFAYKEVKSMTSHYDSDY